MNRNNNKLMIIADVIIMVVLTVLDQLAKKAASINLTGGRDVILIPNVLVLKYLENHGAAFGMLQNKQLFFLIIGTCFVIAAIILLIYVPAEKKYTALRLAMILVAGGAIGNMIDRASLGYVVDFIYFSCIDFPIFNVADIFVTVGTFLLIILVAFFYKDEDLDFKKMKNMKDTEAKNE